MNVAIVVFGVCVMIGLAALGAQVRGGLESLADAIRDV